MSHLSFLNNRGVQATVTPEGRLNLKGLSGLSDETRQEVVTFARDHKAIILSELQPPPPDLSRIKLGHTQEYIKLWYSACELEAYTSSDAPYPERAAKLPELNRMIERMRSIEDSLTPGVPSPKKKITGVPAGWMPIANHQDPNTCRACGGSQWWRKDKSRSKWICGRCHPPAPGLDVIFERIIS